MSSACVAIRVDPEHSVATGRFRATNLDRRLSGRGRLQPDKVREPVARLPRRERVKVTLLRRSRAAALGQANDISEAPLFGYSDRFIFRRSAL